jgi:hypothetical protein
MLEFFNGFVILVRSMQEGFWRDAANIDTSTSKLASLLNANCLQTFLCSLDSCSITYWNSDIERIWYIPPGPPPITAKSNSLEADAKDLQTASKKWMLCWEILFLVINVLDNCILLYMYNNFNTF